MARPLNYKKNDWPSNKGIADKGQTMKLVKRIAIAGVSLAMVAQTLMPATNALAAVLQNDAEYEQIRQQLVEANPVATYSEDSAESGQQIVDSSESGADESGSDAPAADEGSNEASDANGSQDEDGSAEDNSTDQSDSNASDSLAGEPDESGQSDEGVSVQAASYDYDTLDRLKAALKEKGEYSDAGLTALQASAEDLAVLSHADPILYQNAAITTASTGTFPLTGTNFIGLGSDDVPFRGTFKTGLTIDLDRALYNNVELSADTNLTIRFKEDKQGGNLFANKINGNGKTLTLNVQFDGKDSTSAGAVKSPLFGTVNGSLTLNATYKISEKGTVSIATADDATDGNAGVVARAVAPNGGVVLKSLSGFKLSSVSVASKSGSNAGLYVGELGVGASLEVCGLGTASGTEFNKFSPEGTITAANGAAGGMVGKTGEGAKIKISANEVDLTNLAIKGQYSGGFVGSATKIAINDASFGGKLALPNKVGDNATQYAGGFIGQGSFSSDFSFPSKDKVAFQETFNLTGNAQSAGGLFGELTLESSVSIDLNKISTLKSELTTSSSGINYGGAAGKVLPGGSSAKLLTIENGTIESNSNAKYYYGGGLVGFLGKSSGNVRNGLVVDNVTAVVSGASGGTRSFGGAVGCVDGTGTLELGSFKVKTSSNVTIGKRDMGNVQYAAGAVGEVWDSGIVRFAGKTDLSEATFFDYANIGQLVGFQNNALIYAEGSGQDAAEDGSGWTLERGAEVGIDDIASNGEILRITKENGLDGLISLNTENLQASIVEPLTNSSSITLSSVKDFAKLAITLQTEGKFSGVTGVSTSDASQLLSKSIALGNADIDLSGTGLTGLTADVASYSYGGNTKDKSAFAGAVNGNGHTITLAIGEPYGRRGGNDIAADNITEGNGKIYRHDRLGLFNMMTGNVSNLKLAGVMNFKAKKSICAGPLTARLEKNATATYDKVGSEVAIVAGSTGKNNDAYVYMGSLIGSVADEAKSIGFNSSNQITVNVSIATKPQFIMYGGAIGLLDGDNGSVSVNVEKNGLVIEGKLSVKSMTDDSDRSTSGEQIPEGGFIGVIYGKDAAKKKIELSGLTLKGLELDYPGASSVGGLLGHTWSNAEVAFHNGGLKVAKSDDLKNASLKSSGSIDKAGGLVYRASGRWSIDDGGIDLRNYEINNVAGSLGLLVNNGGTLKENVRAWYSYETTGLYLESKADWDKAFKLDADMVNCSPAGFDEWVYTTLDSANEGQNDILKAGVNGVVSLRNADGKLAMTGSECNTYKNRSNYGKNTKKTNASTRYYYNLDKIRDGLENATENKGNSTIDTPEELMLWSAIEYADATLKGYLYSPEETDCSASSFAGINQISGSLDMDGFSYYPVDISKSVDISNATLTFYRQQIDKSEKTADNKMALNETQHKGMHGGLFRNVAATGASVRLNVSNLTLKGSIGMVNANGSAASGALICGKAYGSQPSSERYTCSVIIDGMTLDGVKVYEFEWGYSPLVLNATGSYSSLTVKNVKLGDSQDKKTEVAGSLMGNLGGTSETQVVASFENIALPSKNGESIFKNASLLNSFAYASGTGMGSASYNFTKQNATDENVTYGTEIDRSKVTYKTGNGDATAEADSEYKGKQLWYFDEATYGDDTGLVKLPDDDSKTANEDIPVFGGYLPYVYVSKTSDGTHHEIKVNQRLEDLTTGCGTYSDPYVISKADKLYTLADYVNLNQPTDGWKVTIAKDQSEECARRSPSGTKDPDTSNEITYAYSTGDSKWHAVDVASDAADLSNDTIHRYIAGCYIDINVKDKNDASRAGTLEVNTVKFKGLGSSDNPFRGVLTSTNGTTLKIDHESGSFMGLIPYTYGSVVKNLDVVYTGVENPITYDGKDATHAAPKAFFGGIFGNVLGGDNIIDGVSVSKDGSFSVKASGTKTVGTDKIDAASLVPMGGYIGTITGGGVIFRGKMSVSWYSGSNNIYDNPVVGRVLDGYAFIEGDECKVGDNTSPGVTCNYKINKLASGESITTGDLNPDGATVTTVSDAQGLLVLSAIINSGAAAGSLNNSEFVSEKGSRYGTNAYSGKAIEQEAGYSFGNGEYGKVRNARYDKIGSTGSADAKIALSDDTKAPGADAMPTTDEGWTNVNAPYLVSNYCANKKTMFICGASSNVMDLELSGETYDMTSYGNGYLGISTRYYSNALVDSATKDQNVKFSRDRGIPLIAHIGGESDGGSTIKVDLNVVEDANDDFNMVGVGGLASYLMFTETGVSGSNVYIENVTISGNISHSGGMANASRGVGGIAGVVTADSSLSTNYLKLNNVKITGASDKKTVISGPAMAGGFFGNIGQYKRVNPSTGGTSSAREGDIATPIYPESTETKSSVMQKPAYAAFLFENCTYDNMGLSGGSHTGGFVGQINGTIANKQNKVSVSSPDGAVSGHNSTITATVKDVSIAGLFGDVTAPVEIGSNSEGNNANKVRIEDVDVKASVSLTAVGGMVGNISGDLTVVNAEIVSTDAGVHEVRNGSKQVGGIVGALSLKDAKTKFTNCEVDGVKLGASEGAGGFVGYIGTSAITAENISVKNITVDAACSGGFMGICPSGGGGSVTVLNASFVHNTFNGKTVGWGTQGSYNGGFTADARTDFKLNNILMDSCVFNNASSMGILVGNANGDEKKFPIYVAGLEVRMPSGVASSSYPKMYYGSDADIKASVKKSFVSFANYDSNAGKTSKSLLGSPEQSSPYVTTSPESKTLLDGCYLYGDGADLDVAARIVNETFNDGSNAYVYQNTGGRDDGGSWTKNDIFNSNYISTYGANNDDAPDQMKDYKVLQVSGGDADAIKAYLNAVTNGGFSDAVRLGGSYVKVQTSVYKLTGADYDESKKKNVGGNLTLDKDETPNVTYNGSSFEISSKYDNGENKLTLITVTFSAAGDANTDKSTMTHTVMVPVIVRRQLETTFTATLRHGTNFTPESYKDSGGTVRLLESFGNSSTALLTFQYNMSMGDSTEYGWDSYLAAGGSMGSVDKTIRFENNDGKLFPAGTLFTLVDRNNGDHTYSYKLEHDATSISLSDFEDTESTGTTKAKYSPKWMSELMQVSATNTKDSGNNGEWVWLPNESGATAKAKDADGNWAYYRPYKSSDGSVDRYTLKCGKNAGKELTPYENFYLTIYIPQTNSGQAINGSIQTSIECAGVKFGSVNYSRRTSDTAGNTGTYVGTVADSHSDTPSTYNFVSSYTQGLTDVSSDIENSPKTPDTEEGTAGVFLHMDTVDKITAGTNQLYTASDPLYYKLDASLQTYKDGSLAGGSAFPAGCDGTLKFYVYTGEGENKTYWKPAGIDSSGVQEWTEATGGDPVAQSKTWASVDSQASFVLDYDLAKIRQKGEFHVETKMDIHLSEEAYKAAIVTAKKVENTQQVNAYTSLAYRASLADSLDALKSSSTVVSMTGSARYYREDTGVSTISLTANDTSQLGININDLGSKGDGNIGATGVYDMTGLTGAKEMLAGAKTIVYTLTLEKRNNEGTYEQVEFGSYLDSVTSAELKEGIKSQDDKSIVWTDTADGGFATKDPDSNKFKLSLSIKVDTTRDAHEYANYRLRLTAETFDGSGGSLDKPVNQINTTEHSDYITYTLTRVKLDGLQVKQSG